MPKIKRLIFDADDTLWENNKVFIDTSESFFDLCTDAGYERKLVINAFYDFELKVVNEKGYGSDNYIYILKYLFSRFNNSRKLNKNKFDILLNDFISHTLIDPPVFPGVYDVLKLLKNSYDLYILTKGNIEEQQTKIDRSGLKHFFSKEFIFPEKNDETYMSILNENKWLANECCMIGNSPKSDINPAIRSGMFAIFIPYLYTWNLDKEDLIRDQVRLHEVEDLSHIPNILDNLLKM